MKRHLVKEFSTGLFKRSNGFSFLASFWLACLKQYDVTMKQVNKHISTAVSAVIVSAFLKALNEGDFEGAGELLDDHVRFEGVLGTVDGKDEYISQMAKMKLRYDVKKLLYDDDNVSVLYEIDMGGKTILTSGWYEVRDGKITYIRVIFDPRPVLP